MREFSWRIIGIELIEIVKYLDKFRIFKNYIPILLVHGVPHYVGDLKNEIRLIKIIKNYDQTRFKEITSTKKVINLTKEEFNQLMAYSELLHYDYKKINENVQEQEINYFLLMMRKD